MNFFNKTFIVQGILKQTTKYDVDLNTKMCKGFREVLHVTQPSDILHYLYVLAVYDWIKSILLLYLS